jgi:hypothetical protein
VFCYHNGKNSYILGEKNVGAMEWTPCAKYVLWKSPSRLCSTQEYVELGRASHCPIPCNWVFLRSILMHNQVLNINSPEGGGGWVVWSFSR